METAAYASTTFGEIRRVPGLHGYDAYVPSPLPRVHAIGPATTQLLGDAAMAIGRLAGAARMLPNPHLLIRPYAVREAVASARIEGTQASITDVFEAEAGDAVNADVEEVLNYVAAMDRGIELLDRLPVSARLITDIHEVLLSGVRGRERQPGELRRSQNWIGSSGATLATASFVPPPPDELGPCLADWERFANHDVDMHALIQCALLHYQFETIHPFLDGNGRVGRLLIVLFLVARELLPSPLLYISPYFESRRDEYYGRLQGVRERGEIESWVSFFLDAVKVQSNDAVRRAELLIDLRERYRHAVLSYTRSSASLVVDLAFERPILSAPFVEQRLDMSRQGAMNVLKQLEELGVVRPYRRGPRDLRRWEAHEILAAISEPEPDA